MRNSTKRRRSAIGFLLLCIRWIIGTPIPAMCCAKRFSYLELLQWLSTVWNTFWSIQTLEINRFTDVCCRDDYLLIWRYYWALYFLCLSSIHGRWTMAMAIFRCYGPWICRWIHGLFCTVHRELLACSRHCHIIWSTNDAVHCFPM